MANADEKQTEKGTFRSPFRENYEGYILLTESPYQPGQTGDVTGGVVGVNDPLRGRSVDNRNGGGQRFPGGGWVISGGGLADALYEGPQSGAVMLVPLVFLLVLLVSLDGGFMMSQTAPPV